MSAASFQEGSVFLGEGREGGGGSSSDSAIACI